MNTINGRVCTPQENEIIDAHSLYKSSEFKVFNKAIEFYNEHLNDKYKDIGMIMIEMVKLIKLIYKRYDVINSYVFKQINLNDSTLNVDSSIDKQIFELEMNGIENDINKNKADIEIYQVEIYEAYSQYARTVREGANKFQI